MVIEKVIEKLRKDLIADGTVKGSVSTRVYDSHISTITEPEYPCISLHILNDTERIHGGVHDCRVQVDLWFDSTVNNINDLLAIYHRVRTVLHKENLTDSDIGIIIGQSLEAVSGPVMFEQDTRLYHYPSIYEVVAYES